MEEGKPMLLCSPLGPSGPYDKGFDNQGLLLAAVAVREGSRKTNLSAVPAVCAKWAWLGRPRRPG